MVVSTLPPSGSSTWGGTISVNKVTYVLCNKDHIPCLCRIISAKINRWKANRVEIAVHNWGLFSAQDRYGFAASITNPWNLIPLL
jgi:hypothetical protein